MSMGFWLGELGKGWCPHRKMVRTRWAGAKRHMRNQGMMLG